MILSTKNSILDILNTNLCKFLQQSSGCCLIFVLKDTVLSFANNISRNLYLVIFNSLFDWLSTKNNIKIKVKENKTGCKK